MTNFPKNQNKPSRRKKDSLKVIELKLERLKNELNEIIKLVKTINDEKEND